MLGAAGLGLLAYLPALNGEFLWDDHDNITNRAVVKELTGIWRIWTDVHATQQYYPLTHSTFWLQYQLFGENTLPYHALNLLLHLLTAWLVWQVLRRLGVPAAGLAAALFVVHPLHVESVAWITERKNTLSLPLALAATWFFCVHHRLGGELGPRGQRWFASERAFGPAWRWALGCFVLALAAKTSLSVLPVVLLVILVWKQGRPSRTAAFELLPFFVVGVAAGALTAWIEVVGVNASGRSFDQGLVERILRAARIFWFYPAKLAVPINQSFVYPRWAIDTTSPSGWLYVVLTAAALGGTIALARLRRTAAPLVVLVAYGVLIFPALGFFNVAFMRWSFVQDHFAYAASIPLIAALSVAFHIGFRKLPRLYAPAGAILVATLALLSAGHARHFATNQRLFEHAFSCNPNSWFAAYNLAVIYQRQNDVETARDLYRVALADNPGHAASHNNLAAILFAQGERELALRHMAEALRLAPDRPDFQKNYALLQSRAAPDPPHR